MSNKYYITTPIYYVNDMPHIGHAYTSIASDVIARFMRLLGKDVMFLTGTDEHGQKIEKAAQNKNITPEQFTDQVSATFHNLMVELNISNDDFIRTTQDRHKKGVLAFWHKLVDSGNIYLGKYSGWYSIRDEAFYNESEITEDRKAPTGAPVEWVEEPCYFFALSKWQDKLLDFYRANPDFIKPLSRYNEVLSFVESGLGDLCVSRTSFKWGIPVPGDESHVIYVWLDALTNYISALGYPNYINDIVKSYDVDTKSEEMVSTTDMFPTSNDIDELYEENEFSSAYKKYWPADVHIVGKDILRFHAIYWPAFLMAAKLEIPHTIMAHGWWTNNGEKISKSLGNVIDPLELVNEFSVDYVRYFLMREVTFGSDGNYSKSALISRSNELANKVGNLLQRTVSLIHQNNNAKIPNVTTSFANDAYNLPLLSNAVTYSVKNIELMTNFHINSVLENIILLSDQANIYIDKEAPWSLKNTDFDKMLEVLYILLETLRYIGIMLLPYVPTSADKMLDALSINKSSRTFEHLNFEHRLTGDIILPIPKPVFPKLL